MTILASSCPSKIAKIDIFFFMFGFLVLTAANSLFHGFSAFLP